MGAEFELMFDKNGKPLIAFIDKGNKKVNVGSKLSDFNVIRELGKGNFGSVKLVSSNLTHKLYAMKEIKASLYKSEGQRKEVEKEIKLLENLDHPHIIKYFTSFSENNDFYIITEYINGQSLESLLKKNIEQGKLVEEKLLWKLLIQSLSGLLYLHETKKIIHRDIKPDNLLLDLDGNLKISDFGVSAINSENVEDLLRCHGTIRGPIEFMAPEAGLGLQYDFKSDLYMLGLTFYMMMSKKLPEKKIDMGPIVIPVKYQNAKLPESYSETLRNFVQKLLNNEDTRPSTKRAFSEAIALYSFMYLKVTSIISALQCFSSIPTFRKYFKGNNVKTYIENDENTQNKKYLITSTFNDALNSINPTNFNFENAKIECTKLRIILYGKKDINLSSPEIDISDIIPDIINKLHSELHKPLNKAQNSGDNDINIEDNDNDNNNNNKNPVDETNEKAVIAEAITKFSEKCRSKMSDLFFYLSKTVITCPDCEDKLKYMCLICCVCGLYPDRAAQYLNKKDLDIIDLFKHYRKKRLFLDENVNCPKCGKVQKDINRTKIFYTCPYNLFLDVSCANEDKYNLTINENINIEEFVERKDISKTNYKLMGAIFIEQNEEEGKKYVSITKTENNGWIYFNGKTFQECSFDDLVNHKKLRLLLYSSL